MHISKPRRVGRRRLVKAETRRQLGVWEMTEIVPRQAEAVLYLRVSALFRKGYVRRVAIEDFKRNLFHAYAEPFGKAQGFAFARSRQVDYDSR